MICSKCLKPKTSEEMKPRYTFCRECYNKSVNDFRKKNLEYCRERDKKRYKEHTELAKARSERYRLNHPDAVRTYSKYWYDSHKEESVTKSLQYRKSHPDKVRKYRHDRRAREKSSGTYDTQDWNNLVHLFGNKCLACGKDEVTVDHVIPLSKGGLNTIDNLQPLCLTCNVKKNAQSVDYRDQDTLSIFLATLLHT